MSPRPRAAALIAVDGIDGAAIVAAAQKANAAVDRAGRGGVSRWDASGVFEEMLLAGDAAGRPSARTLLLLYAADLAFRLRWEIRPALDEGRTVVAAPYVDTAVAFGRAAGVPAAWIASLFQFAPRPSRRIVEAAAARQLSRRHGFVELACTQIAHPRGRAAADLADRARAHLLKRRVARPR
jgi:thymidylate kinase